MRSFDETMKLPLETLIEDYDQTARHTSPGQSGLLAVIAFRTGKEQGDRIESYTIEMRNLTKQMRNYTIAITGLTMLSVAAVVAQIVIALGR